MVLWEWISWVERHLWEKGDAQGWAAEHGMGYFQFHRMFLACTGETPAAYLRKRRLSEAAVWLETTRKSVLDVAFDAGYGSHEAFTRAFAGLFRVTPVQYRMHPGRYRHRKKLALKKEDLQHLATVVPLRPRLVNTSPVEVYGVSGPVVQQEDILALWRTLPQPRTSPAFGVFQWQEGSEHPRYLAGHTVPFAAAERLVLPEGPHAVFVHPGEVETLPLTYRYIYGTWLSREDLQVRLPLDFEHHVAGGARQITVWVPVH